MWAKAPMTRCERCARMRSAEVFGLEREREAQPRVGEVAAQIPVDAHVGTQVAQRREHGRRGDRPRVAEGLLQNGPEGPEFHAIVIEKGPDVGGVAGREARDLGLQAVAIGGGPDLPGTLEHEVVMRVEPPQLDMVLDAFPAGSEDLG